MDIIKTYQEFAQELERVQSLSELENLRIKYLGRKGLINSFIKEIATLPIEEKKVKGKEVNDLKNKITEELENKKEKLLKESQLKETGKRYDLLLPGRKLWLGYRHPITKVLGEIVEILVAMGFEEKLGPEIETEWHNYEALNFPEDHPARDQIACFYLSDKYLLRSHTSPIQIRVMEKEKPPIRIIAPGRVFRPDPFDASHSPVFYQVEGLYIDENVNFCELKGTLEQFCYRMFGNDVKVRFTPSYFPFTEPSAEIAISCVICESKGCKTCKNTGWLEILGAGMVHPKVLENVGYDSTKYSGFAFGLGVERIAMVKYRIDDIRLFYENDIRFLSQF
ncbi:MAG: phenylalanine--tRNA ligase subunit alpha [candidate division WOR-3 bacterium]|nr:phenylalanine--tRNA ligase subunit alpha [candidate division WOR-3 bacterium]MCX7757255.1 phenylalanine--tRNA ligase subunit alpha [candidate division WOR-3 bacterium]MDW7987713.1 phenylalanine--tRNA ligase subunit alpha [candidate division WOR-3 bacterium]